ncbi:MULTISPECIES: hypothetical protein [Cronobacter]|uniref:hypothetical protein n=2 Tax=Cronobacter TaxID=413496 RepID=UPI0030DA6985
MMDKVMNFLDDVELQLSSKQLKVGFLRGATYPDGTSVAMVAASNEFGNPRSGSPPRPFFRNAIAEKSDEWAERCEALMKAHGGNVDAVLDVLGMTIVDDIQRSIGSLESPPLSPVTLLLRDRFPMRDGMTFADVLKAREDVRNGVRASGNHSKPLIWTGHMQRSVDYEVSDIESSTDSE